MRSLISEFSYGFALTHEFVKALRTLPLPHVSNVQLVLEMKQVRNAC